MSIINLPGRKFPKEFSDRDASLVYQQEISVFGNRRDDYSLLPAHDGPMSNPMFARGNDFLPEYCEMSVFEKGACIPNVPTVRGFHEGLRSMLLMRLQHFFATVRRYLFGYRLRGRD
jgi:hypothetical protein